MIWSISSGCTSKLLSPIACRAETSSDSKEFPIRKHLITCAFWDPVEPGQAFLMNFPKSVILWFQNMNHSDRRMTTTHHLMALPAIVVSHGAGRIEDRVVHHKCQLDAIGCVVWGYS